MPGRTTVETETEKKQRFERWVRAYSQSILHACFIYLVDKSQAEDAMQDTFLKAWEGMDQFAARQNAQEKTWLMRIAINVCHDYQRSRWFRYVDTNKALEDLPSRYLTLPEADRSLLLDILRLPVKQKQVILLYYYQEMSLQETADALGIAVSTAHHRLKKAEKLLKIALTGGEEDGKQPCKTSD